MDLEIYVRKEFAELLKEVAEMYRMPVTQLARLVMTSDDVKFILEYMKEKGKEEGYDRKEIA